MANEEQIRYWNEQAAARWVALSDQLDFQLGPLGRMAMDRARIGSGTGVLDVGCGCGDTTLELGRRVGASGHVVGVDISMPMLDRARARAAAAGAVNVVFEQADAQSYAPPRTRYDTVFSRFGVMFFENPQAAFENLRELLAPGGRLAFVCWRALAENAWLAVPLEAAAPHVPLPQAPEPNAPGPFAFAQRAYVTELLERAGYESITFEPVDRELDLAAGGGVDAAVEFVLGTGLVARAIAEANLPDLGPITASLRRALSAHARNESVLLGSASWIVMANRPKTRSARQPMTGEIPASDF